MENKRKSFTLIELLVVIVIIGILAGVIMISTSSSIDKASIAKSKVFEESVQNNLAANMVSAWDADHVTKGTTWVLNDKWGSNNGTFYDNTSTACTTSLCPQIVNDEEMGNVLSFDGVNDNINCGNNSNLNIVNQITVGVWINPITSEHAGYQIVSKKTNWQDPNGYDLMVYPTNAQFYWGDNSGYGGGAIGASIPYDGRWKYIVGIVEGNVWKLYINGAFINSFSHARYFSQGNSNNLYISKEGGYWFKGLINDIKIYNTVFSSSQIKQNYIAGLNSMLSNENISKEEYNERINELAYE